jgi:hypothetical protein
MVRWDTHELFTAIAILSIRADDKEKKRLPFVQDACDCMNRVAATVAFERICSVYDQDGGRR